MLIRTFLVLTLLISVLTFGQNPSLPPEVRSAKTIFIENETGNSSVLDSVHLVLASSRFTWTDDRDSADLVFTFDRTPSQASRSVSGNAITIAIRNTYTLEVSDLKRKSIWKESADLGDYVRKDLTERSYIEALHQSPAAQLVDKFLAAAGQSR